MNNAMNELQLFKVIKEERRLYSEFYQSASNAISDAARFNQRNISDFTKAIQFELLINKLKALEDQTHQECMKVYGRVRNNEV